MSELRAPCIAGCEVRAELGLALLDLRRALETVDRETNSHNSHNIRVFCVMSSAPPVLDDPLTTILPCNIIESVVFCFQSTP